MIKIALPIIILLLSTYCIAQQPENKKTLDWNLSYTCDAGRNHIGGLRTGAVYMGMLGVDLILNSDKYWKGTSLNMQALNTHGDLLSGDYIGDQQVVSNIENGDYTFLELFYLQHDFSFGTISLGLQDFNAEFCVSGYGGNFTNSSFGIHSAFPLNFGVPIFPKTAIALTGIIPISDELTLKGGVWDGDPKSLDDDKHNLDWSISNDEGFLFAGEVDFQNTTRHKFDANIGLIYHTSEFQHRHDSTLVEGKLGLYANIDKELWSNKITTLGVFGQLAYFPSNADINEMYFGGGMVLQGISEKRKDDCLSLGCAFSSFYNNNYECDIECNYSFNLNKNIAFQPALHYIVNPGAEGLLENSLAGFLRVSLSLN